MGQGSIWGDVPSWVEAIGTTAAFFATLALIVRDRNSSIRTPADSFYPRLEIGLDKDRPKELTFLAETQAHSVEEIRVYMVFYSKAEKTDEWQAAGFRFDMSGRWGPRQRYTYKIADECCSVDLLADGAAHSFFRDHRRREWQRSQGGKTSRIRRFNRRRARKCEEELKKCVAAQTTRHEPEFESDGDFGHY